MMLYLSYEDYLQAAVEATGLPTATVQRIADRNLAESALRVPADQFDGEDEYPTFVDKVTVLFAGLTANQALPDGNARTALLCTILFANLNGFDWVPPVADGPDGRETAQVVEAAAAGLLPYGVLRPWIAERLWALDNIECPDETTGSWVIYPAEYVGELPYVGHTVEVGELRIHDVHGYNPARVYVRRTSGIAPDGITVAEIIITAVGDGYFQEELDEQNAEAERYPLGPKEYWRARMVGKYRYGADSHLMTDQEFEDDWSD